jgi:hypothetical protein
MNYFKNALKELKVDEEAIKRYEEKKEVDIFQQRQFLIERTTPKEFINADIKNIDNKIINFTRSNKIFCWIYGVKGVGKTYSLYAIRNYQIYRGNSFDLVMEGELNYDKDFRDINAVDNLCISDSKIKFLSDYYFNLIDYCWKHHKKLYLTSTKKHNYWIEMLSYMNNENAEAIASRFSNAIEIIELKGDDRRKYSS